MTVRVRMFAALREAAGTGETTAAPGPLPELLDDLADRYGEPFSSRLAIASVLVDGDPVDRGDPRRVPEGAEVALLPPFSGGAEPVGAPEATPGIALLAPALALAAAGATGVVLGGRVLFATVTVAALLLLVDLQALLHRIRAPAVLPASALLGLGLPVLADRGLWHATPTFALAGFAVTVLLVLVSKRHDGAVRALGITLLVGLLPGLGAGALVVLSGQWGTAAGLVVGLVAAAEGGRAAARWRVASAEGSTISAAGDAAPQRGQAAIGAAAAALVAAVVLHLAVDHDLAAEAVAALAAVAVLAVLCAATLRRALITRPAGFVGTALRAAGATALAAPLGLLIITALS